MRHFGSICDPSPSHVAAMVTIGRELAGRGDRFTLFHTGTAPRFEACDGFHFRPLGPPEADPSKDYLAQVRESARLSVGTIRRYGTQIIRFLCENGPPALRNEGIDFLLTDQCQPAAGSIANLLGIPFVTIAIGLPQNREPDVPPFFWGWKYEPGSWNRMRNRSAYATADFVASPMHRLLNSYRGTWGLPVLHGIESTFSDLAQISQLVRELDFPRKRLPDCFHYVGPFGTSQPMLTPFPYDRLSGKPLVYASLGTILDGRSGLWSRIIDACAGLEVDLVLSLGGCASPEELGEVPANAIVVTYAPQAELMERAALVINSAGINTVQEALGCGVPLLLLPATNDQPGMAARVQYAGVGKVLHESARTVAEIRSSVTELLGQPNYRERADVLRRAIQCSGGTREAVDIIERAAAGDLRGDGLAAGVGSFKADARQRSRLTTAL